MKSKLIRILSFSIALGMILAGISMGLIQFNKFQKFKGLYPYRVEIANVPVSGLTKEEAAQRIQTAYQTPVELHYNGSKIHIDPDALGFQLNIDPMLSAAEQHFANDSNFSQFWSFLWNKKRAVDIDIPLDATIDQEQIRKYLNGEISPRYDQPAISSRPQAASLTFTAGKDGQSFNIDLAIDRIETAMQSIERRTVVLAPETIAAEPPSMDNLQLMIQQTIDRAGFDGLVEVFMKPLNGEKALQFAYQNGENLPTGIAFTAASTIKIPIMVSVYRRIDFPPRDDIMQMLTLMITESKNEPSDRLMEVVLDPIRGPLVVTEDMQALGFRDTFLAGYFYMGAALLNIYETPANTRTDVNLQPDIYNQTTPGEMGALLGDIYNCAETNSGPLVGTFAGQVTQEECRQTIELLSGNKLPYLITAGIPEGIEIAHKHGWIEEADGLLHTMSDAGVVYSPGGDFVLTIYMYHPEQLVFDQGNSLIADISKVVYSFFNPDPTD